MSPKFGVAIGGLKAAIGPGALKPTKVRVEHQQFIDVTRRIEALLLSTETVLSG